MMGRPTPTAPERRAFHTGYFYRAPRELRRSAYTPIRVLVVGACLSEPIAGHINWTGFNSAEWIIFNNLSPLPSKSREEIDVFDFQIVQIPLRSLMPEGAYLQLAYEDVDGYAAIFAAAAVRLELMFEAVMRYNAEHGLLTFVHNFLVPQQNPMGRLFPKYDLRNPVYFVSELNKRLCQLIDRRRNAYLLDADEVTSTHGKRFFQDDALWLFSHGSVLDHYDHSLDQDRIEPPAPVSEAYEIRNDEYRQAIWHEAVAMYESVRQSDAVKMVVIDLDDTLWRGELAEQGGIPDVAVEGWPLGFLEALIFLKRRGILLGIISRNDEDTIIRLWHGAVAGLIRLDDFAVRRINWDPKPDNMRDILAETNLLPSNVVYIDDHPVQRAAMAEAFPDIRVMGRDLYYNRRILLWSPETQVATVTAESARRTEMIQAQAHRESDRQTMSQAAFLESLDLRLSLDLLSKEDAPAFERCFELLNKTNQFNTTGRRWTLPEIQRFFAGGGVILYGAAEDRFTTYGVIWVALVHGQRIEQAVMSCRVVGLGVETAALAAICDLITMDGGGPVVASTRDTPANILSRDLFEKSGFERRGDGEWRLDAPCTSPPPHIRVETPQTMAYAWPEASPELRGPRNASDALHGCTDTPRTGRSPEPDRSP